MSTPFTIDATNWQQIDKLEELRLGYSERRHVMGRGATFFPDNTYRKYVWNTVDEQYEWQVGDGSAEDTLESNNPSHGGGFNAQSAAFWSEMQGWFEDFCEFVVDPSTDYTLTGKISLAYGDDSWKKFCEYVGGNLYTSETDYGFRRGTPNDDGTITMYRGTVQDGDCLGAWLIEDMVAVQQGFNFLFLPWQVGSAERWSRHWISSPYNSYATYDQARANALSYPAYTAYYTTNQYWLLTYDSDRGNHKQLFGDFLQIPKRIDGGYKWQWSPLTGFPGRSASYEVHGETPTGYDGVTLTSWKERQKMGSDLACKSYDGYLYLMKFHSNVSVGEQFPLVETPNNLLPALSWSLPIASGTLNRINKISDSTFILGWDEPLTDQGDLGVPPLGIASLSLYVLYLPIYEPDFTNA